MIEHKPPIKLIKLESLNSSEKDIKIKSIYDLKMKIKDEWLSTVVRYLNKGLAKCDVDPEIYFSISNIKNLEELCLVIERFLDPKNSRKYDDNARHILHTLKFLIEKVQN